MTLHKLKALVLSALAILSGCAPAFAETKTDIVQFGNGGVYDNQVRIRRNGAGDMTFQDVQVPQAVTLSDLIGTGGSLSAFLPGVYHEILEIGPTGNTWQKTDSPTFTGLTIPTGAVNGYVWTTDGAGVGSWQSAAGSIFPTMPNGNLLIGDGDITPVAAPLTGTTNQVNVTNGAGSITLATPQDIDTSADVQFQSAILAGTATSPLALNQTSAGDPIGLGMFRLASPVLSFGNENAVGTVLDTVNNAEAFYLRENGVDIFSLDDDGVSNLLTLLTDGGAASMTAELFNMGVTVLQSSAAGGSGFLFGSKIAVGTDPVSDTDALFVNEWDLGSGGRFEALVDDAGQMATHHRVLEVGANSGDVGIPLASADGFGPRVVFTLKDSDLVKNTIASIDAKRNGADNTGRMQLAVNVAAARTVIADLDATEVNLSVPLRADLNGATGNGLIARVGAETFENRTLTATAGSGIAVTNGDGVAGNPTVALNMDNVIITQTVDTSTGSTAYVQMAGMTHTVSFAGTYLFTFSGSGSVSGTGNNAEYAFHFGAGPTIQQYTERNLNFGGGAAAADFDCAMHTQLLRVMTVGENVQVMYRTSGGTFTVHERTIMVMKLSD